jgi:hypothetical protein
LTLKAPSTKTSTRTSSAKELREDIVKVSPKTAKVSASAPKASATKALTLPLTRRLGVEALAEPIRAKLVIERASLWVAEHIKGCGDLLEARLGLRVIGVLIGVKLAGELSISLLNVFVTR